MLERVPAAPPDAEQTRQPAAAILQVKCDHAVRRIRVAIALVRDAHAWTIPEARQINDHNIPCQSDACELRRGIKVVCSTSKPANRSMTPYLLAVSVCGWTSRTHRA